ncbi:MAG: hypothetical protein SCARUB_04981 [Candidatus Scalindua rubra]|uniref:Uncharacterized protein n=1 Tax=Candidatus Scalindua rubra TaxID=1872076 RepID=A0A1E3X2Q1_9BACT|nr:MAG: hypothetical protein SCARUB_04981 [Candidatus Scalindua rubra]
MKNKKIILTIVRILIIATPVLLRAETLVNDLVIIATIDKDTFLVDEPIYIEFKQVNTSTIPRKTTYLHLGAGFFFYHVFNENGHEVPFQGMIIEWNPGHARIPELKPGESMITVKNILGNVDKSLRDDAHHFIFYLKPGRYSLYAELNIASYKHKERLNRVLEINKDTELSKSEKSQLRAQLLKTYDVEPITIESNHLTFTIVEPKGDEAIAHEALLDSYQRDNNASKNGFDNKQRARWWREYIDKYKNSVYAPIAIDWLTWHRGFIPMEDRPEEKYITVDEVLPRYKDSIFSKVIAQHLAGFVPARRSDPRAYTPAIEILEEYIAKYPGTKFSEYAELRKNEYIEKQALHGDYPSRKER